MADKLPFQITPGTPNDASVVHASDADESDLSRSHNERDISRLQGTVPNYSSSKEYNVNDLVEESGIVYRNKIAIGTPESFDRSKWDVVWSEEDIEYIFEESDFPAPVSGVIPLVDGKLYRICAPITLSLPLFLPIGGIIALESEAKYQHTIDYTGNTGVIKGTNNVANILSFADDGGDLLITTATDHNLSVSDLVNIRADSGVLGYSQVKATVLTTPSATTFTIAGTFSITDTGVMDQGALVFEMKDLFIFDDPTIGLGEMFTIPMTGAFTSFCDITNCRLQNFANPGKIITAGVLFMANNQFVNNSNALVFDRCEIVNIFECNFRNPGANVAIKIDGQDRIIQNTIANCVFNMITTPNAILITPVSLKSDASISVFNCVDVNTSHTALLEGSPNGIDETDPRVTALGNIRQKNSISVAEITYPLAAGILVVTPTTANVMEPATSTDWTVFSTTSRYSLNSGPITGEFTYDGLDTIIVVVSYFIAVNSQQNNQEIFAGILKNGVEIGNSRITGTDTDLSEDRFISFSFTTELVNGDVLQFGAGNVNNTNSIDINAVQIIVTRLN